MDRALLKSPYATDMTLTQRYWIARAMVHGMLR